MWGIAGIVFFLLWAMLRPREPAYEPAPPPQSGSSGAGGLLLVIVLIGGALLLAAGATSGLDAAAPIVVGDVQVRERVDNHTVAKHGVNARETLQRSGQRDYYYSQSRETVMVTACDAVNCACMFVGVKGRNVMGMSGPAAVAGGLELTCYYMAQSRVASVISRDGYAYMGRW